MKQKRLDEILIENKFATNKKEAFILVTEGRVFADGRKMISPAQSVGPEVKIEIRQEKPYVGRGGYKLAYALEKFGINIIGKVCADIGSATGGFTEVLLKNGAKKVYAIDTARGKLALKLREDYRVAVMEGIDARDLQELPEPADIVTIDVSLITLREILMTVRRLLKVKGTIIALFKPQYETRDPRMLRRGVVKDSVSREKLLHDFLAWTKENSWQVRDSIESPIRGSKGNVEYLLWLHSS